MSRRLIAYAFVAVLIVSLFAGLGTAAAPHAAPSSPLAVTPAASPRAVHPAAGDIAIATYDANNDPTTVFCTGSCYSFEFGSFPYESTLILSVADSAADLSVNVTINDLNATRDGLVNPVFSANLGIDPTTHENITRLNNHLSYTFPASLAIGGLWNITASAPLGGFTSNTLIVRTYSLSLDSSPYAGEVTVPGETVSVSWIASASNNGATYTHLTSLIATGTYNGTGQNLFNPGLMSLPLAGAGTFTFQIPANATPDTEVFVDVWAVVNSSGIIAENETGALAFWVGQPQIAAMTLSATPDCNRGTYEDNFASGSPVYVCLWIRAHVPGVDTLYVPGLPVTIGFWNGTANVTPAGDPPTALTTTANGPLEFSFIPTTPLLSSQFHYPYYNSVNVSVTDPVATTPGYLGAYENFTFFVIPAAATGSVEVVLNAVDYDVGATVTATWTLSSSNTSVSGTLVATQWALVTDDSFVATGPISSTSQTGTVAIPLPSGFVGPFEVYVIATNASGPFVGIAVGLALQPVLSVSPDGSTYFSAGETLTFQSVVAPAALPGTTLFYNITGEWYNLLTYTETGVGVVAVGSVPASGAVSFTVPSTNPAQWYYVTVWAQSTTNGIYAWNSNLNYTFESGFAVLLGISTASSYSDGSYQPGQTVQVSWALSPLGNAPLPSSFTVYLYLGDTTVTPFFQTTSSSGTTSITIPSNTPSGWVYLYAYVYALGAYGPDCQNGYYCYGETGLTVNAHPSALSYELGAGSGLTVGWLILLVVIIVVALLLVLMIRRGRRPSMMPMGSPTTQSMAPPAPPPSSPPAAEWKSPTTSNPPPPTSEPAADAPPPLPTPPGGSP